MPTLSIVTEEAKLPVVCGEGGMVKTGGTATLGIDYYKLGVQTGEMAADILAGKAKPQDMAIQSQKDFEIVINEANARKIDLNIPEEIMKKAVK
jgi:putative ABC transport system substrate-binding protein